MINEFKNNKYIFIFDFIELRKNIIANVNSGNLKYTKIFDADNNFISDVNIFNKKYMIKIRKINLYFFKNLKLSSHLESQKYNIIDKIVRKFTNKDPAMKKICDNIKSVSPIYKEFFSLFKF